LRYNIDVMNPAETVSVDSPKVVSERDLVNWTAPARPFKRRDRRFYVTTFSIAGIIGLILFLAEGFMPVLLVISIVFLYYVLSTVEPENIEYKVTNLGIKVAGSLTRWNQFRRFWFTRRFDNNLLVLETISLPGRMEVVVAPEIMEKLKKEISEFVPFEEIPASGVDNFIDWISKKLPGNK